MIHNSLIQPDGIVVIGGSDDPTKPGGGLLNNLMKSRYKGEIFAVNKKKIGIDRIKTYGKTSELPDVDLAILTIPARDCIDEIRLLANKKNTRGFIIISSGFGEESAEGRLLENELIEIIKKVKGSLIGPNCIGIRNQSYHALFTTPIPLLI